MICVVSFKILGYCCIIYMQCSTSAFRINTSTQAAYTQAQIGSNCPEDYIGIEGIWVPILARKIECTAVIITLYTICILWSKVGLKSQFICVFFKASSQSGVGNSNNVYCGGFLNDFPAATTDAKIKGTFRILLKNLIHLPFVKSS